jgi:CRP-like cAMP-binding protein
MPPPVLERITPHLEFVRTDQGKVLLEADQPINRVYFPTGGLFSLLVRGSEGEPVEAAIVGREGMLGITVVLGAATNTFEELCQIDGNAVSLPTRVLCDEFESDLTVRALLLAHVDTVIHVMGRNVACNRLHLTEQRLARWLLQVRDRVGSDTFYLTQEFLGHMLGVRRPTVSEAVGSLTRAALIRHQRGRIRILDDAGLEAAACEDYARIRARYAALASEGTRGTALPLPTAADG